jgi:hypothetical protein
MLANIWKTLEMLYMDKKQFSSLLETYTVARKYWLQSLEGSSVDEDKLFSAGNFVSIYLAYCYS